MDGLVTDLRRDFFRARLHSTEDGRWRQAIDVLIAPGFHAVCAYRVSRWLRERHVPVLGAVLQRAMEVWAGVSIPASAEIGRGLVVLHFGGIVLSSRAVLGEDCTLHHGVTIGNRNRHGGAPRIGDRVQFGVGAKVLGEIEIGRDVDIGANAVVLDDMPNGAVAVGIPAHTVRMKRLGLGRAVGA